MTLTQALLNHLFIFCQSSEKKSDMPVFWHSINWFPWAALTMEICSLPGLRNTIIFWRWLASYTYSLSLWQCQPLLTDLLCFVWTISESPEHNLSHLQSDYEIPVAYKKVLEDSDAKEALW